MDSATIAHEVCDPAEFRARASTNATHRKMTSARDVDVVLTAGQYCTLEEDVTHSEPFVYHKGNSAARIVRGPCV